uniref:Hypothethical protein n=1 Tax=Ralstonia solanacearum TaxID=305 RepID=A0A0S4WTB1_RALSL|nr:Hypothethical protein [Ralstonia solanacearum]CUV54551.1 Hypothethical protein [Ralstonia solanacearum]
MEVGPCLLRPDYTSYHGVSDDLHAQSLHKH